MHEALHAPNFLGKWLSILIRRSINPVIEERLSLYIRVQKTRTVGVHGD